MYKKSGSMKKTLSLIAALFLLSGCAETFALLGPITTIGAGAGSGKAVQSAVSSAMSYGVKKQTGKSPSEHALIYMKKNNPENKKEKCIGLNSTNSKACAIANKKVALVTAKVKETVAIKKINFKKQFAKARKAGENSFIFNNKIYNTTFKESNDSP